MFENDSSDSRKSGLSLNEFVFLMSHYQVYYSSYSYKINAQQQFKYQIIYN